MSLSDKVIARFKAEFPGASNAGLLRLGQIIEQCEREGAPKSKRPCLMPDAEWIKSLEGEPALAGVDVRKEIGKAQFWCKQRNKKATRKFLVNWLNNAPRELTVQMDGQSSKETVSIDPYREPPFWRDVAAGLYGGTDYFTGRAWNDVSLDYRKAICNQLLVTSK